MRGLFAGAAVAALLMSATSADAAGHHAKPAHHAAAAHAAAALPNSADAKFRKIYTDEWAWREEQLASDEDAQKPIEDHLPKVDAASQEMRLKHWEDVIAQVKAIPRADLSPDEQVNYDVYVPQIEDLIASQKFRDYEMPVNSDTTFWTDLGYTARQPFKSLADYQNWIAQMRDIPRYFHEEMDEM